MKNISKKFLSLLISVCMVVSVFPLTASATQVNKSWQYAGDSSLTNGQAEFISAARDSGGKIYVAYRDDANSGCATVKTYDSGTNTWDTVGVPNISGQYAIGLSLTISDSGTPYLLYRDYAASQKATVKKYDSVANTWETVGTQGFTSGGIDRQNSIVVDRDGTVYIAYEDVDQKYDPSKRSTVVMKYDESQQESAHWEKVGTVPSNGSTANPSLAVSPDGTLYLSYAENTEQSNNNQMVLRQYSKNDDTWKTVGGLSSLGQTYGGGALALDNEGNPCVAFRDSTLITVKKYDVASSIWETIGSPDFTPGLVIYTSLAFDKEDHPYFACTDSTSQKPYVMKYDGSAWATVGDYLIPTVANYTSIVIGADDIPYVAFSNGSLTRSLSVMRYTMSSCTVTYSAGAHGTLNGSASETVNSGANPQSIPTVTPASGYSFTGWSSDGGATVLTDLSSTAVTSNVTYTACYTRFFPAGSTWKNVGGTGFSKNRVDYLSLAVSRDGTPYVAYQDVQNQGKATVMKYTAGSWKPVGNVAFSAGDAYFTTLAIGSDGTPYVAYKDSSYGYKAVVMKYTDADGWKPVGNPGFSEDWADNLSLALDSSDTPYVAYQDYGNSRKATVMKYTDADGWKPVGNVGFSAGEAVCPSLKIAGDGTPYIAYRDGGNSKKATVMKYSGSNWQNVGSSGFSSGEVLYTTLALSKNDTPYVTYQDVDNSKKATVMKYSVSSGWQNVGSPDFSAGEADWTSLAFDSCDTPYVVYRDVANSNQATVMKFTGSDWQAMGNAGFSGYPTYYNSIAFDRNDTPYVAFWNENNSLKASVMTYAPNTCTVTYDAGLHGMISGSATENVLVGGNPQHVPSLRPDSGYTFVGWSCDGGTTLLNSAQLAGLTISTNVTYTAYYASSNSFTVNGIAYKVIGTNPNRVEVAPKGSGDSYSGSVTVPASVTNHNTTYGVTEIGEDAFSGCDQLTNVTLPNSITSIGKDAFGRCTSLTGVNLPTGLSQIGDKAFLNCIHLSSVNLPSTMISIGTAAFAQCPNLTGTLQIPAGLQTLGSGAFAGSKIIGFTVDTGNTHYCAVDGVLFSKDKSTLEEYPDGKIGNKYSIPSGTTSIEDYAFAMSTTLTNITIPSGVTAIGAYAFGACTVLTDLTIPASVTSIDVAAFYQCISLTNVKFNGGTVPTLLNVGQDLPCVFASCNALRAVYVSANALQSYQDQYLDFGISRDKFVALQPLSAPTGLSWSNGMAAWSAVENASDYTVTLSKNGVVCASAVTATNTYNFLGLIAPFGSGTYTFTVTANGGANYGASTSSIPSAGYSYTVSSSGGSSSDHTTPVAPSTQTQVNAAGNRSTVTTVADSITTVGDTAQITASVTNITTDTTGISATLNTGAAASVEITLPKDAIKQQLAAKRDVDLIVTVPHSVAQGANPALSVDIKAASDILAAAKASETDITIKIKDADTQQTAYTWTFKGADLAKSITPVTDVNVSMAIRLTTEVPQVHRVTPQNLGLVLMFDHSGVLPSTASVTFSAKEKGFKPGQKLFFYYYNPITGQIDAQNEEYTVDFEGNVTVKISHCSNYVLLPNKARTITLDTRTYTMAPGQNYITGVKLTGVSGTTIKAYSSTKGVANVTVLKNGNVKATGLKTGMTYIMIDVYDSKNKLLTHASVRLTVKNAGKPNGNSARQYGIF